VEGLSLKALQQGKRDALKTRKESKRGAPWEKVDFQKSIMRGVRDHLKRKWENDPISEANVEEGGGSFKENVKKKERRRKRIQCKFGKGAKRKF